jgi:hypothetical protein
VQSGVRLRQVSAQQFDRSPQILVLRRELGGRGCELGERSL